MISSGTTRKDINFASLLQELEALLSAESDGVANAANLSAFVWENVPKLNWIGFYFYREEGGERGLVLGPFQGRPACTRIPWGRGVCGRALVEGRSFNVPDVSTFQDHIVCDKASRSELVVPLARGGKIFGVLDVDSPQENRFDPELQIFLERAAEIWLDCSSRPQKDSQIRRAGEF